MIPRFLRRLFNDVNERRLGVKTGGYIQPEELGFPGTAPYAPSPWLVMRHVFRNCAVSEQDVFVDYGSGMGRVLVTAARKPFKRVIGIEHSEDLNRVARANIDRTRHRLRCADVEVVTADAGEWEVPDDVTSAYLYAPFPVEVLERVVEQLLASVDRSPRTIRLAYYFLPDIDRAVLTGNERVRPVAFKVPRLFRKRLRELWMYDLVPGKRD